MKKAIPFILFCISASLPLFSHPHMLVYTRCELEFDGESNFKGVWIELEFDDYFSSEIIWAYDENRDGSFNERETERLYRGAFSSLGEYNYFTFIRVGDKRFSPESVESFSARAEGSDLLFYKYFVPLENMGSTDFHIAVYDYSFFCAVWYQEEEYLQVLGSAPENISFNQEENEDFPVYYNPKGKINDKTLYDRWAPGLSTFIPVEIHVEF